MALQAVIELDFEKDPSRLLEELGLTTKQFEATKSNILTRLVGRPDLAMIVLEFRRGGMYYGEVTYDERKYYAETRKQRGEALGRARGRDSNRPTESEVGGDDGVLNREASDGWSLERLLRSKLEAL